MQEHGANAGQVVAVGVDLHLEHAITSRSDLRRLARDDSARVFGAVERTKIENVQSVVDSERRNRRPLYFAGISGRRTLSGGTSVPSAMLGFALGGGSTPSRTHAVKAVNRARIVQIC